MHVTSVITLYLIALPIFAMFDLLWLGLIARGFYQSQLGHLLGPLNWYAALIFYAVFLGGLVYFALMPALLHESFARVLVVGALYGFFTYATYDLTNQATLKSWPVVVTVVDIVWGTMLGAVVAALTYTIHRGIFG
jgi:uncharacterized membrane protein